MNKYVFFTVLLCGLIFNTDILLAGCLDSKAEKFHVEIVTCSYMDLYDVGNVFMKVSDKGLQAFKNNEFEKTNIAFEKHQFSGALLIGYEKQKKMMSFINQDENDMYGKKKERISTFLPTLDMDVCRRIKKGEIIVLDRYKNCCEGKAFPSCWFGMKTLVRFTDE